LIDVNAPPDEGILEPRLACVVKAARLPPCAVGRDLAEEVGQLQIAGLRRQPLDRAP